ncbi:MAG: response regulator transcription factor [Bilophila wadsworthia]
MSVSIVIAEDHALFRSGLKQLLLLGEGLEVIGEAGDGFEAVTVTVAGRPDLLLLDLSMPGRDGLEVIAHIRKECPDTRIYHFHARHFHAHPRGFQGGAHNISSKRQTARNSSLPSSPCRGNRYVSTERLVP